MGQKLTYFYIKGYLFCSVNLILFFLGGTETRIMSWFDTKNLSVYDPAHFLFLFYFFGKFCFL